MSDMTNLRRRVGRIVAVAVLIGLSGLGACDFLDPTEVENPRTTPEDLAQAQEPTAALLPGIRAEFAGAINAFATTHAVASDDYSIHGTGMLNTLDFPERLTASDLNSTSDDETGLYFQLQETRALADFVLDEIVPDDDTAPPALVGEAHFYRGMTYLMLAESFRGAPVERNGAALSDSELLQRAVTDLQAAESMANATFSLAATGALARAHRAAGDATAAVGKADELLAADGAFLWSQGYDALSITNTPWAFLVLRSLQEMQPLPRLDFLDPKYLVRDQGIPVVKAEEMHLILAEAALANGQRAVAQAELAAAIELAETRPAESFDDEDERLNGDFTIRPRDDEIVVRADADSPFRAGLVLDRPGVIEAPVVSATSLSADSVLALTTTEEVTHALYLARQEILFLEGRRTADLGIKLPIMQREADINTSVEANDAVMLVFVPGFIPPDNQIDEFTPRSPYTVTDGGETVTLDTTEITIRFDMNRLLVENRPPFTPVVGS